MTKDALKLEQEATHSKEILEWFPNRWLSTRRGPYAAQIENNRCLQHRRRAQIRWINEHGTTITGYIKRYGTPGKSKCYGDGGAAIYRADILVLFEIDKQLGLF